MQDNNEHAAPERMIRGMETLRGSPVVEFDLPLHVVKKCGRNGTPDAYTVAIWDGTVLRSLCLFQPLETALSVIETALRSASKGGHATQSEALSISST